MQMEDAKKDITLSILYFAISTIVTAWFIDQKYILYTNDSQMLLSGAIAGGKWAIQITLAVVFLKHKKFEFIRKIGEVCAIGSLVLLTFYGVDYLSFTHEYKFIIPIMLAVLVMIILYLRAVISTNISLKWFFGWILCLIIAVFLQLSIVFHVI